MPTTKKLAALVLMCLIAGGALAQNAPAPPKLKDEMRMPWTRGDERFLRLWLIAGPFTGRLDSNLVSGTGGEGALQAVDGQDVRRADGTTVKWHSLKAWGDEVSFDEFAASGEGTMVYAFAKIQREKAGNAVLSFASLNGIRVWLNGTPVLSRDGLRSLSPDEDQVEAAMHAGENSLLVKLAARGTFMARILEPGTVAARRAEIGPSIVRLAPDGFTLRTDCTAARADADEVKVEVIQPGGKVLFAKTRSRGETLDVDAEDWADGPYEIRCTTRTPAGLLYAAHLPWYKGEFLPKARQLAADAAAADASKPEGFTLRMLAEMVEDRLGCKLAEVKGNPWQRVHSPLMEYDEMMLEREGRTGRIRPFGFVRLAYRDEVDGSPQYCRAYLPAEYDPGKKWPLVIQMHGYNPANPVYVRWWAADERHVGIAAEYANHQGVIYMEPHGRGNTQYLGMGDSDILRVIAEAKRLFNVDEDRIYLTGDSMGGWGTWNVGSRHPDLFAAIAPVFGGSDYHSQLSEEELSRLGPLERFVFETQSSWAMADGLLNVPIFVRHGDQDQAVNVEYSRWAVKLLQRWGYDVHYREYPGRIHEALESQNGGMNIEWFLQQRRNPDPPHVRLRSAELRNASAYWVRVNQAASPLAFMVVDAEVVDRNVIRLDTENALDIDLTPSQVLVDPAKPVKVFWNGEAREMEIRDGRLHLAAPGYAPAALQKHQSLPGAFSDFTVTPFAVVVGTISRDTAMATLCREKAAAYIAQWQTWQNQPPRVFADTAMRDEDMARYSLLLVGGADANSVTAKLAARLPLDVSAGRIVIDGKAFPVRDAAVQMLYPNPLNPERYVWVTAGSSADGMYFAELNPQVRLGWDYMITDGRIPAYKEHASALQTAVVTGVFDHDWRFSQALAQPGDSALRARGRLRHRPVASLSITPAVLDAYVGRYQITEGPSVQMLRDGRRLLAKFQGAGEAGEVLLAESETSFVLPRFNVWLSFVRDAKGKVTGLIGYQGGDFEGKKLD